MQWLSDYRGLRIRLTEERREHILEHPEMAPMESAIAEALAHPHVVVESLRDADAQLYYRYYSHTMVGGKFVCVVVKIQAEDAFVLTAYLTDQMKKGNIIWTEKP